MGNPRTIRILQRYCASGHLDAQKTARTLGDKYLITSLSFAHQIVQIQELGALDNVATDSDMARHTKTPENEMSRYVVRLEREVKQAKDENDSLHEQIDGIVGDDDHNARFCPIIVRNRNQLHRASGPRSPIVAQVVRLEVVVRDRRNFPFDSYNAACNDDLRLPTVFRPY